MILNTIKQYTGKKLPQEHQEFLRLLESKSFSFKVTGSSHKTIRILYDETNIGYLNNTVIRHHALVGYRFLEDGYRPNDACPNGLVQNIIQLERWFCSKYGCQNTDIYVFSEKSNAGLRMFLEIKTPEVALKVLQHQVEGIATTDEDSISVIEGRLKEINYLRKTRNRKIVEQRKEKDKYTCQACGFKLNYNNRFLIEVHHLISLSNAKEETITKIEDLICLCPTCHAIAHLKNPPLGLEKIKNIIYSNKSIQRTLTRR